MPGRGGFGIEGSGFRIQDFRINASAQVLNPEPFFSTTSNLATSAMGST